MLSRQAIQASPMASDRHRSNTLLRVSIAQWFSRDQSDLPAFGQKSFDPQAGTNNDAIRLLQGSCKVLHSPATFLGASHPCMPRLDPEPKSAQTQPTTIRSRQRRKHTLSAFAPTAHDSLFKMMPILRRASTASTTLRLHDVKHAPTWRELNLVTMEQILLRVADWQTALVLHDKKAECLLR